MLIGACDPIVASESGVHSRGPIYAATAVMPGQQRSRVVIKKMQDGLNPGERQAAVELIVREAGILFSLKSPYVAILAEIPNPISGA